MTTLPFSVTQNGKPLSQDKYTWDPSTCTFSTNENNLVIDANCIDNLVFKTGSDCTFTTDSDCTFKTGFNCTFNTSFNCTFNTGSNCTFTTGENCVGIRYDVPGITQFTPGKIIKYNDYQVPGYTLVVEKEPTKEYTMEQLVEILGHNFKLKKND